MDGTVLGNTNTVLTHTFVTAPAISVVTAAGYPDTPIPWPGFVPQQPGLEAFAVGPDGKLGRIWQTTPGGGWSSWADLGPAITGDPAVVQNADGRLEVFAKGSDGNLGHIWQLAPGGGWSSWADLGPAITGDPAVALNKAGP